MLAISSVSPVAFAHQDESDDNTTTYGSEFFEVYKPVTLSDMIRHVQGGVTLLADLERAGRRGGRGFGSTGAQILLNGKRMPGKANDMGKALARIQASQVDHIDLIRGTSEGLDIRSEGVLINVILKEGAGDKSTTFVEAVIERRTPIGLMPGGLITHNGSRGALKYGASYQYRNWARIHNGTEQTFNSDGSLREDTKQVRTERDKVHTLTGNISYAFDNGNRVNLNGLFSDTSKGRPRVDDIFLAQQDGSLIFDFRDNRDWVYSDKNWEFGGDYETPAGALGNLKALFIVTNVTNQDVGNQDEIIGDTSTRYFAYLADYTQKERIVRASLTKAFGSNQTLEYGAEAAYNRLDKTTTLDQDPSTNTKVSEDRYEIFVTYSWNITPDLSLQSALNEEFSSITQTSMEVENTRSFKYLKPRFELRYDFSKSDQLRLVADHKVSQLNLNDFIVSRNVEDDTINIGNPDLVPYKVWTYSIGYEHQLAGNAGSIEAKFYYEDYKDHIDQILIEGTSSGVGNIGDANRMGIDLGTHLRLAFLGVPNAMLTVNYHFKDSEVIDPFTGQERQMKSSYKHYWTADFQHDLTDINVTYGFNMHHRSLMPRQDITILAERTFKRHLSLFAEYKIRKNIKIRAESNHVLGDGKMYAKTVYDAHIADGIISRTEYRQEKAVLDHSIKLQVTF